MHSKTQGLGPSTALPGHDQGAGSEVEQSRLQLAPMWDFDTRGRDLN